MWLRAAGWRLRASLSSSLLLQHSCEQQAAGHSRSFAAAAKRKGGGAAPSGAGAGAGGWEGEAATRAGMAGAVAALVREYAGLRAGRASPGVLESLTVEAYGARTALKAVASVSALDAHMLSVVPFDASLAPALEKAIREGPLGLNPRLERESAAASILVPIPKPTPEHRKALVKMASQAAEDAKAMHHSMHALCYFVPLVSMRRVRKEALEEVRAKKSEMAEDDFRRIEKQSIPTRQVKLLNSSLGVPSLAAQIQALTDEHIKQVGDLLSSKEKDILA
eukprot:jgi/Chlat1/4810/Chrsp31S00371